MAFSMVCVVLDRGREECVDKGGLSEARFTSDLNRYVSAIIDASVGRSYHDGESSAALCDNLVAA